jgi:predicted tellurium resistance membrane protein TerC
LLREEPPLEFSATHLSSFWKAMWFVVVADVTMSTDNIIAVASIAHGDFFLLLFGLPKWRHRGDGDRRVYPCQ